MTATEKAEFWLTQQIDLDTIKAIEALLNENSRELEDAFYKDLDFGTGGMRGIMGVGSNRVNKYTLGIATQGLSNYLRHTFPGENVKVAIAYDCRNNSRRFAELVADVFSANDITVFLFEDLRPTPELSFAIRHLGCQSGVVITASHNPPEYNGYKVYWGDGAQIVEPHDRGIIAEVRKILSLNQVRFEAREHLIHRISTEVDEAFLAASLAQRKRDNRPSDLNIVFTPLHGTSITLMPELLHRAGYTRVHIVEEQAKPDGNFPTVKSPNPEEREALEMALHIADQVKADVVLGTDPDSDRIGVAVRDLDGKMVLLNGNQCGVLLTDYLLRKAKEQGTLTGNEFIAYTIVSSDMFRAVASHYGCDAEVCLTGFKYIASLIRENEGKRRFVGGGEESYGYMVGDFVRDKDSLTSAMIFCDLASEAMEKGSTVMQELMQLYRRHGLYHEHLVSITKKGKEGSEEITRMMQAFRENPPTVLGGERVVRIDDLETGSSFNLLDGSKRVINLPSSNVLQFFTEGGSKISARPSGTEPKIKFYFSVRAPWNPDLSYSAQVTVLDGYIAGIIKDLGI